MLFFTAIPTHSPGLCLESGGWIPAWPGTRCSGSRREQVPSGGGGPGAHLSQVGRRLTWASQFGLCPQRCGQTPEKAPSDVRCHGHRNGKEWPPRAGGGGGEHLASLGGAGRHLLRMWVVQEARVTWPDLARLEPSVAIF